MKIKIKCLDKYEAQKLSSLIFIKDSNESFVSEILNIFENEVVVSLKDKSAHSVLLKNEKEVEVFADFIQSVIEKQHKIVHVTTFDDDVEITKQ